METGVGRIVVFHCLVVVGNALNFVSNVRVGAAHEVVFVIFEVCLDSGAKEGKICCIVTSTWETFASQVAGEDLLLEGIEGVGNSLEILQVCDCLGDRSILTDETVVSDLLKLVRFLINDLRSLREYSICCF